VGAAKAQEVGPNQQFYPVYDFRNDWLVYDPTFRSYVPFIDEQHATIPAVSLFLDLESNRRYQLLIRSEEDGYLFINAALRHQVKAETWVVLSIDSLYRAYRTPELFLTLYGSPGVEGKQVYVGHRKPAEQKPVVLTDTGLDIMPRRMSIYDNFFTLVLLFLLATHAFLYNFYRRAFERLYSIRDLFTLSLREESFLVNKPLSRTNLLFVLNLSFVTAFIYLYAQSKGIDVFDTRKLLLDEQTLLDLILAFFKLSGLLFLLLLGKYLLIAMITGLYRLEEISSLHFFKILQSSLLFFTAVAGLVAALGSRTSTSSLMGWIMIPFVAYYVARMVLLYLVISRRAPIKNLYLFSYLCIVELIPLIIGARFAL